MILGGVEGQQVAQSIRSPVPPSKLCVFSHISAKCTDTRCGRGGALLQMMICPSALAGSEGGGGLLFCFFFFSLQHHSLFFLLTPVILNSKDRCSSGSWPSVFPEIKVNSAMGMLSRLK